MEVRLLGPIEVTAGGEDVPLGGARPRTIVAVLALRAGRVVPIEGLVDEVWPQDPPRSAIDTLQSYLSRLRGSLGRAGASERLVTRSGGYELRPDRVDALSFAAEVEHGRREVRAGRPAQGAAALRAALERWRGPALEQLARAEGGLGPVLRAETARLEDLRLAAIEERIDAELALGAHDDLAGELAGLVCEHPHRERLHAQRMLALYRAGRQADALAAYSEARSALVEELGIEPGKELRDLQERILAQDHVLLAPSVGRIATRRDGSTAASAGSASAAEADDEAPGAGTAAGEAPGRPGEAGEESVAAGADLAEMDAASGVEEAAPTRPGGLPAPLGGFVGRTEERALLAEVLERERLVTLTGAGGCGKTQLALQVAADVVPRFPAGAWLVELGSHADPRLVPRAVADALGVPDGPAGQLARRVERRLAGREGLLVLDNCEHLIDACAELASELLAACPQLTILATSREPLDIPGERTSRVPSLALPPAGASTLDELAASEAVELFAARAAEASPGFVVTEGNAATVARVCRELDGIPLALELAAARLRVLTLEELAERLGNRFQLLRHGRRTAPPRHRTLEAAIDWSHDLLGAAEQRLLARLAVFAGGFTLDAVEAVCAGDGIAEEDVLDHLAALVDKSLAHHVRAAGPARHDLLETVRSYAAARLDERPGEVERLRRRHAGFFATLAERAAPALTGPDQVAWLNRLHVEHDNLRVVLARGDVEAARVAAGVWWFWLQFGHVGEGDRWVTGLLAKDWEDAAVQARLLLGGGRLAGARGDLGRSVERLVAARDVAGAAGEGRLGAVATARLAVASAEATAGGAAPPGAPDADVALAEAAEILAGLDDPHAAAELETARGLVAWRRGELGDAAAALARAERAYRDVGDEWSGCLARLGAARVARRQGDAATALRLHRENLSRSLRLTVSTLDFVGLPQDLHGLAALAGRAGAHELAAHLLGAAAALHTAVELPVEPAERVERARTLDAVRLALGSAAADAAYERGQRLSVEDAVNEALERTADLATDDAPGSARGGGRGQRGRSRSSAVAAPP